MEGGGREAEVVAVAEEGVEDGGVGAVSAGGVLDVELEPGDGAPVATEVGGAPGPPPGPGLGPGGAPPGGPPGG